MLFDFESMVLTHFAGQMITDQIDIQYLYLYIIYTSKQTQNIFCHILTRLDEDFYILLSMNE